MPLYYLYLVPDAEPNADSTRHLAEAPIGLKSTDFWSWAPKPGFHVVAYSGYNPQDGGPMHANHLPQPVPEFIWSLANNRGDN